MCAKYRTVSFVFYTHSLFPSFLHASNPIFLQILKNFSFNKVLWSACTVCMCVYVCECMQWHEFGLT